MRRPARLVVPAVLVALGYVAWELLPLALSLLWDLVPREVQRSIVAGFLNGLMVSYVIVIAAAILGLLVAGAALARSRGPLLRRPWLARLLLLDVTLFIGVIVLETATSAWMGWLHRAPPLPNVAARPLDAAREPRTAFQRLNPVPARGALSILVIGESSARGEPYHPWLSVGQIVGWKLEEVLGGRPVQVDIWASGGATLEQMHQKLALLDYRPDALLVFSGHNEFQSRWAWSRNPPYYVDEQEHNDKARLLDLLHQTSPACRLILETMERQRLDAIPPRVIKRQLVDRPACTESERAEILSDFRRRLEAIAGYCESIGTVPIFVVPASNDGGYEPSRSILHPTASPDVREAFARRFRRARELEKTEPSGAVSAYKALLKLSPGFAESHYRLARLLEQEGSWDEARLHYTRAREFDAMPLRCPEAFRQAYRDAAARHSGIVLVDSDRVLAALSPHGILDDHLYHDAQHPNFLGYLALAQDLLMQLHHRHTFGWPATTAIPIIDPDNCARHFQLDQKLWVEVCDRVAWFWEATAFIRHDPAERLERGKAYRKAAKLIASGQPPGQVGIEGLGTHLAAVP
jgi:hypothetical protein